MDFSIRSPVTEREFEEYYALRWRLLRAPWGQPRGSERDAFDADARHVAAYAANGALLGIGRLHFQDAHEGRIRYMAVEPRCQGRGVGTAIARELESLARTAGAARICLNAREAAVGFYERLGFRCDGAAETLFGAIRHTAMSKVP